MVRIVGPVSPEINISLAISDAVKRGLLRDMRRMLRSMTQEVQRGHPVFFFLT